MGYVPPPERALMKDESRESWYLERRAELLRAKNYNEGMLDKWTSITIVLIFILVLLYIFFIKEVIL